MATIPIEFPEKSLRDLVKAHGVARFPGKEEAAIRRRPRSEAQAAHASTIGWRMENIVPLAWAPGHRVVPRGDAA